MAVTTVFQSGNSPSVRRPEELRFTFKTVDIFGRGDDVVLREIPRTMGDLIKRLPAMGSDFPDDIPDTLPESVPAWDAVK